MRWFGEGDESGDGTGGRGGLGLVSVMSRLSLGWILLTCFGTRREASRFPSLMKPLAVVQTCPYSWVHNATSGRSKIYDVNRRMKISLDNDPNGTGCLARS
jgi:hypothetical protein